MRFPARQRLRRQADFAKVRGAGRKKECGGFAVFARIREAGEETAEPRLGVVTSRRIGPAVTRNLVRRVIREIFRARMKTLPDGCDVVVVARRRFRQFTFREIEQQWLRAIAKITPVKKTTRDAT